MTEKEKRNNANAFGVLVYAICEHSKGLLTADTLSGALDIMHDMAIKLEGARA